MTKLHIINILTLLLISACSLNTIETQRKPPKPNNKLALQTLLLTSRSDLPVPDIGTPFKDVLDLLDKRRTQIIEITDEHIKVKSQSKNWNSQQTKQGRVFVYMFENGFLVSGPNFYFPEEKEDN